MTERLKYQGRLAETELEEKRLKIEIEGIIKSLRENLDPFEEIAALNVELIADQALRLAVKLGEYKAALATIESIKKVLGRE